MIDCIPVGEGPWSDVDNLQTNSLIHIFVEANHENVIQIKIVMNRRIYQLRRLFDKNVDVIFTCGGRILNQNHTFAQAGIKDREFIRVYTENPSEKLRKNNKMNWTNINTHEADRLYQFHAFDMFFNEISRINDIRINSCLRHEHQLIQKPEHIQKLIRKFESRFYSQDKDEVIISQCPNEICTEPLPVCWSSDGDGESI